MRPRTRLFHVSEEPGITSFEPRPHPTWPDLAPGVWVVAESHLRNYLLPRDCPRVTFYSLKTSLDGDVALYLDGNRDKCVVAVEQDWIERIQQTKLFLYEFEPSGFESFNVGAGYFRAEHPVEPQSVHEIGGLEKAIVSEGAEFRTLDNLWPLSDKIVTSSLQFSMIRMRNAKARPDGKPAVFGRNV